MFPLMLLKNIKSHYWCSKMQTRECVTNSVSKFILPFGHNNVASAITHLFNLLHPSCYLKCLMSSGSDSVFFQSQWTFLNTTVSPPPLKVCVSLFIWHLCFFLTLFSLSYLKLIILCYFPYFYTINEVVMKVQTKRLHPSRWGLMSKTRCNI